MRCRRDLGANLRGRSLTLAIRLITLIIFNTSFTAQEPADPVTLFPLEPLWQLSLNAPPQVAPTSDGTHLYVPLPDEHLIALTIGDGMMQWSVDQPMTWPAVVTGNLLLLADNRELRARNINTGAELWTIKFDSDISAQISWFPDGIIVGLATGNILSYRIETGDLVWQHMLTSPIDSAATINGEHIFLPMSDGRVVALELMTGEFLWERQVNGTPSPILVSDGTLFVGSTDNFFYSLNAKDGSFRWRWRTGGDIVSLPLIDDRSVYFVSLDNQVRALNRNNGVQRWKQSLSFRPTRGMHQTGALLALSGRAPVLQFYFSEDGTPAGTINLDSEMIMEPLFHGTPGLREATVVYLNDQGKVSAWKTAVTPRLEPFEYLPGQPKPAEILDLAMFDFLPGVLRSSTIDQLVAFNYLPGLNVENLQLQAFELLGQRYTPPLIQRLSYLPGLPDIEIPLVSLAYTPVISWLDGPPRRLMRVTTAPMGPDNR